MTHSDRGPTDRNGMGSVRKTALVAGIFYLITFATSIPAVLLLDRAVTDPNYVTGAGADGLVRFAALLDLANALACIGTAVALYSVLKRQHEGLALGFVTSRTFEAGILLVAVLAISSLVTLRESGASAADTSSLVMAGQTLVAVRDWSFGIGTGMAALNALLLGTLMYRSRLVPRFLPVIGLVGGVLFSSFVIGYILGITEHGTAWHSITVAPIFLWELALGLWMTLKGFNRSAPIVAEAAAESHHGSAVPIPPRSCRRPGPHDRRSRLHRPLSSCIAKSAPRATASSACGTGSSSETSASRRPQRPWKPTCPDRSRRAHPGQRSRFPWPEQ